MVLSNVFRYLFAVFGVFSLFNGIIISMTSNANLGNFLTLLFGTVLILLSLTWKSAFWQRFKRLKTSIITVIALVLAFISFLVLYGKFDNTSYKEDAVIVLGAGLRGERPSLSLISRLEAAIDYHQNNRRALIIVSGGKGHDEDITEALAMERYLIARGVPKELIIKEEDSTSTYENFVFSKRILDERLKENYKTVFITNEYHIFRAGQIAKIVGMDNSFHVHSSTLWHSVLPGTLRECLAVAKHFVLGY